MSGDEHGLRFRGELGALPLLLQGGRTRMVSAGVCAAGHVIVLVLPCICQQRRFCRETKTVQASHTSYVAESPFRHVHF